MKPPIQLKALSLLIGLILLTACSAPMTKERYLEQFREFVSSVENSTEKGTAEFWAQTDSQYDLFRGEWYRKFKSEMTWRDELTVAQLQARYVMIRSASFAGNLTRGARLQYAEARDQLLHYLENDMQADVERMIETIKKSTELLESEIQALVREFDASKQP